jgi:hypothetical protein
LRRLRENVERAMQGEPVLDRKGLPTGEWRYDGAVANRALELLGKELGLFIERREQGRPGEFAELSNEELASGLIATLMARGMMEPQAREFIVSTAVSRGANASGYRRAERSTV